MRGTCVSFWLHGPSSISRRCNPLRMLGAGHCCVRYGLGAAPERKRSIIDHVTASPRPHVRHVQPRPPPPSPIDPFLTLCPSSFPFASPQSRLPTTLGSPLLALSSCQDNSVRDASPVELSLRTTYRWTPGHTSLFLDIPSHFCMFPCHSFVSEFPLPLFYLPFLFSIRHRTTPFTSTRVAYLYITLSPGLAKIITGPIE